MKRVINLKKEAEAVADFWSPRVVGQFNDQFVKVAKLKGEFTWHQHDGEDELFLVLGGELVIRYRDREDVRLTAGDIHIVPKGVQHNPLAEQECIIALLEPVTTLHTGEVILDRTKSIDDQLKAGGFENG